MKKRRYGQFNPKRELKKLEDVDLQHCSELAEAVQYGGNPEHKMNPGDFGLTPPSGPRAGKSLCDDAGIFSRKEALEYLKLGLCRGMISKPKPKPKPSDAEDKWPQNYMVCSENRWQRCPAGSPARE